MTSTFYSESVIGNLCLEKITEVQIDTGCKIGAISEEKTRKSSHQQNYCLVNTPFYS